MDRLQSYRETLSGEIKQKNKHSVPKPIWWRRDSYKLFDFHMCAVAQTHTHTHTMNTCHKNQCVLCFKIAKRLFFWAWDCKGFGFWFFGFSAENCTQSLVLAQLVLAPRHVPRTLFLIFYVWPWAHSVAEAALELWSPTSDSWVAGIAGLQHQDCFKNRLSHILNTKKLWVWKEMC